MKTAKSTIILTLIIFIVMTLLTMKHEAISDGIDTYGFPYIFYEHFEGKCDNCYDDFGFKPRFLFTDFSLALLLSYCVIWIKNKFSKSEMLTQDNNYVKVLFRFHSNVLDEETVETMWATIVDKEKGFYKLDSIPFYAPYVASDDIVFAEFDDQEQMLTYRKTVGYSGNSTVQIVLIDKSKDINQIRDLFKELGCVSEKVNEGYFAMEIPSTVDYKNIKKKLVELETQETIGYAEPCLADGHKL
ncbi:DUF4265 domain-containing protein [Cytophaga hutchinsonii]|nr:DUF4265 domain-containing protein [Cytophaga hutchinsonii]